MADLKGKLLNPKDHKAVEEGLKTAVGKSQFDVGFENLTEPSPLAISVSVAYDQGEVQAIVDNLDANTSTVANIVAALKALGVNINGS